MGLSPVPGSGLGLTVWNGMRPSSEGAVAAVALLPGAHISAESGHKQRNGSITQVSGERAFQKASGKHRILRMDCFVSSVSCRKASVCMEQGSEGAGMRKE